MNGTNEIEGAKQKMHEICGKKRWPKPTYRIVKEEGPSHERKLYVQFRLKLSSACYLQKEMRGPKLKMLRTLLLRL
ncbi:unnamed protein product [Camellia sinensis]